MQVVLEVIEGSQAGARFVFDRHDTFMVGRSKRTQFTISGDRFFSRFHFMIEANPPECFLRDLGSTNGTLVNGKEVSQVHLKHGDVIRGGLTSVRVRVEEGAPVAVRRPAEEGVEQLALAGVGEGQPDVLSMETLPQARAPRPGEPGRLRCTICGRLAEDTHLGELTDTRMITYVCSECHRQHSDAQHPVPNFEVLAELRGGSLGPVYKARRIATDKVVVLKLIAPALARNPQAAKLFLREMQIGAQLDHPNILPIIEIGESGGDLWVATEFVDGPDAAELAGQLGGRLPLSDATDIVCQVLDALQYAHGLNLVHRDVKPTNILVTGEPGSYFAYLSDFGLMRNVDEAGVSGITRKGEVRGTVGFMPPEQVLDCRFVKPPGDIYQVGATLYWMLTGEYAYDFEARDPRGETKDPFVIILEDAIVPMRERNPSVPEAVAQVIETCLSREPEDRLQTAADMAVALRRALS